MEQCLATNCVSAPDAAYGAEYGKSWCKRAGVDVDVELPAAFVQAASDYFECVFSILLPHHDDTG